MITVPAAAAASNALGGADTRRSWSRSSTTGSMRVSPPGLPHTKLSARGVVAHFVDGAHGAAEHRTEVGDAGHEACGVRLSTLFQVRVWPACLFGKAHHHAGTWPCSQGTGCSCWWKHCRAARPCRACSAPSIMSCTIVSASMRMPKLRVLPRRQKSMYFSGVDLTPMARMANAVRGETGCRSWSRLPA